MLRVAIATTAAAFAAAAVAVYLRRRRRPALQPYCSGQLHAPILSDESLFALEDDGGEGRLLTVTMTKREPTKGSQHWPCAIKGEGVISTKDFGVPVTTVNPNDPAAMKAVIEQLNEPVNKK